ncbi:MAG: DUF4912 domain-containing protein [Synechococcaceae cyanobacterium]|nr:DUF4912 domain-containing protein [Synechococcaceae cyanobacterium]
MTFRNTCAMAPQPDFLGKLTSLPLRRLRELARVLGIPRYSAQARDGLVQAIASKSPGLPEEAAIAGDAPQDAPATGAPQPVAAPPAITTFLQFLPQDSQWAYCRWEINPEQRQAALAAGAGSLCLRLADVTGLAEGDAHPHAFLETVVDGAAGEWYLPVPLAGRVYRAELGYRLKGETGWYSLTFSSPAFMPAEAAADFGLDPVRPFSLELLPADAGDFIPAAPAGLHERTYQVASLGRRRLGLGSEEFQEQGGGAGAGGQDSGAGRWASGLSESGRGGVTARQRSFWLVADAELIVYGATEPSARLTVGSEEVPLSVDGTFHFQVPFPDGDQNYPIQAVAADGEQKRSITLDFKRTTPSANVNTREAAIPEWF